MFFQRNNLTIKIKDKGTELTAKKGTNLYKFLIDEKVVQRTLCDGAGQCGKCKFRILDSNLPKPTYKETLILAKVNLELGYRLACQQIIKKDMVIDLSEFNSNKIYTNKNEGVGEIIKIAKKNDSSKEANNNTKDSNSENTDNIKNTNSDKSDNTDKSISSEKKTTETNKKENTDKESSQNNEAPTSTSHKEHSKHEKTSNNSNIDASSQSVDGILLIQQRYGIRYLVYSSLLGGIEREQTYETDKQLKDLVLNDEISDFLYYELKITDIERIIVLTEYDETINSDIYLDMFRYRRENLGTMLLEIIMPTSSRSYEISHFFRVLNANTLNDNRVIFSLENLSRTHYTTSKIFADMNFKLLLNNNLFSIKAGGYNRILSFDNEYNVTAKENKDKNIDGITFTALLQLVQLLLKNGIINNKFQFKTRNELTNNNIPLSISVRIRGKDKPEGFYVYRDRFTEIFLTQEELNELYQIKAYMKTIIDYVKEEIAIDRIILFSAQNHIDLVGLLFDLDFFPNEYINKIDYRFGESTINITKLFKEKDIPTFISKNFGNNKYIDLVDEKKFIKAALANNLDI